MIAISVICTLVKCTTGALRLIFVILDYRSGNIIFTMTTAMTAATPTAATTSATTTAPADAATTPEFNLVHE